MPDDSSFVAVLLIGKTHMVYLCGYTSEVVVIHPVRGYTTCYSPDASAFFLMR